MSRIFARFALAVLFAARCPADDTYTHIILAPLTSHSDWSKTVDWESRWVGNDLRLRKETLLNYASELEAALREYNVSVPDIDNAREILADMEESNYWLNLESRITSRRRQAGGKLSGYLYKARASLGGAQKRLNEEDERAYQAWAITHPKEAKAVEMDLEIERRFQKEESEAREAQAKAESAEAAAATPGSAAYEVQKAADAANEKAAAIARDRNARLLREAEMPSRQ